jgi:hypothetical protein
VYHISLIFLLPSSAVGNGMSTVSVLFTIDVVVVDVACCPAMLSLSVIFRFVRCGAASRVAAISRPSGFCH